MNKTLINPTIGSDFEIAVFNKRHNAYISGIDLIGGDKNNPISIGEGCSKQEDNVAAEFCIPPVTNLADFQKYIGYCLQVGNNILKDIDADLELRVVSSAVYDEFQLLHPKAMEFGCDPSFSIYTKDVNHPKAENAGNLRTFGFHIHLGWENINDADLEDDVIFLMDLFLGVPSIILDPDKDRRRVYGAAGDFRYKSYGVEYRTLGSNMMRTPELIEFVFNQTLKVIEVINNQEINNYRKFFSRAEQIINNQDAEAASKLLEELDVNVLTYV